MSVTGINCRATNNFVSDGASETYWLGEAYPFTRAGLTFGDTGSGGGFAQRDRNSSPPDVKLAGIAFNGNSTLQSVFQFDVTAVASNVRMAMGDESGGGSNTKITLKDNSTTFATIGPHNPGAGAFYDAADVSYADTAWAGSNSPVARTFSTTTFNIVFGDGVNSTTVLAHISVVASGGASSDTQEWFPRSVVLQRQDFSNITY